MYMVYKQDWECPEQLFSTLNKQKAEDFVTKYNSYYDEKVDSEIDHLFIITINTDIIDKQADELINNYQVKRITEISIENGKQNIEYSRLKYCSTLNDDSIDECYIGDFCADDKSWQQATIKIITEADEIVHLDDEKIQEKINKLIEKETDYLYELYSD